MQTEHMPYAESKDNILKQLCEVQLLMTLPISIILRTDLENDAIAEQGYDIILVIVNVVMVPSFMFVAGVAGLASLLILLHQYANKVAFAKKWQKALHSWALRTSSCTNCT